MRIVVSTAVALCLVAPSLESAAQVPSVVSLLDRYYAGRFDEVVDVLAALPRLDSIVDGLKQDGEIWIAHSPAEEMPRRELAAATFALEAARVGVWSLWKTRHEQPAMTLGPDAGVYRPEPILVWAPAAQLIEWGCERFRRHADVTPLERWWQLGAIAVAERAEDHEFLIGDERAISNPEAGVVHLRHALSRFPNEPRFLLVKAIALEWRTFPESPRGVSRNGLAFGPAIDEFDRLVEHDAIGPEATVRLGSIHARMGSTAHALQMLNSVEDRTRDKYLIYLARFFRGRIHEAESRPAEAIAAYRGAVATLPGAQGAALALATLLASADRRDEAAELAARTLDAPEFDPWRGYADADDRFWPEIIAKLRKAIKP